MKAVTGDPALEVTVDIERRTVSAPAAGLEGSFELDEFTRHRLLEGLDDIGLTLRFAADIDAYEASRPAWMPAVRP
jgi:3-isopropylmalate/(R)-2-methylmalate dehydratase small subunit